MIFGMLEYDFYAFLGLGIVLNFILSVLFGLYLTNNIGMDEMILSAGKQHQNFIIQISLFIPFLKSIITMYRVFVLQIYFLNQGKSHKDFWIYLTNN